MLDPQKPGAVLSAMICLAWLSGIAAQNAVETDLTETVETRLFIVDVLVVDKQGNPVAGLTKDDFELVVGGKLTPIKTFDVDCAGHAAEVIEVIEPPVATPPRMVIAIDYLHVHPVFRTDVIEQAKSIVRDAGADEEFMVAALAGGMEIEQEFTNDKEQVLATLDRMYYDARYNRLFEHMNETPFFAGLRALFTVLELHAGPKAMLFFSDIDMPRGSRYYDLEFQDLSADASACRTSIYPVVARGLDPWPAAPG